MAALPRQEQKSRKFARIALRPTRFPPLSPSKNSQKLLSSPSCLFGFTRAWRGGSEKKPGKAVYFWRLPSRDAGSFAGSPPRLTKRVTLRQKMTSTHKTWFIPTRRPPHPSCGLSVAREDSTNHEFDARKTPNEPQKTERSEIARETKRTRNR